MKHLVFLFTFLFIALGLFISAPKAYAFDYGSDVPAEVQSRLDDLASYYHLSVNDNWGFLYSKRPTIQGHLEWQVSLFANKNGSITISSGRLFYYIDSHVSDQWYVSTITWDGDPPTYHQNYDSGTYREDSEFFGNFDVSNVTFFNMGSSSYNSLSVYGSVDSISNAGLLARMYDITFTPTISYPSGSSLLNQSFKAVPVAVRDDTGYNVISLQVPQLGAYADTIFYGQFHFKPHFSTSEYYFNTFKMSFGSDPLNENDDVYDGSITPNMFHLLIDINGSVSAPSSKIMTVNSLSFFYNSKIQKYSNREFVIFDYSSDDDTLYPDFRFEGIGSINMYSAGTIVYNCDFSGLFDVSENAPATPDKVKQLSDEGNIDSSDTVDKLGYIPRDVSYPDFNQGFDIGNPDIPDFSVLGNIFSFMFENRVIRVMLLNCLLVGLAGFVLYGKKGGG